MRLLSYLGTDDADLVRRYWLDEPDAVLRSIVIEAAEQLPKEKGFALLSEIAQTDDRGITRGDALDKLVKGAGTDYFRYLARAVDKGLIDVDDGVRERAIRAAGDIDKKYAVAYARNALTQEAPYSRPLFAATEVLGGHGDLDDLTRLGAEYVKDRFNEYTFGRAIKQLVQQFGSEAVLAKANQLPDKASREAACKAASS